VTTSEFRVAVAEAAGITVVPLGDRWPEWVVLAAGAGSGVHDDDGVLLRLRASRDAGEGAREALLACLVESFLRERGA
jgi:hypothetical protein